MSTEVHMFQGFETAQDVSVAADSSAYFVACSRVKVIQVGCYVTTDIVTGGTSVLLFEFDRTTASQGVTASETTAPARSSALANINGPTTSVTVQDGKVITENCDFVLEKGERLNCQCSGTATSGNATPFILYQDAGEGAKEAGQQRGGLAVE